MNSTLDPLHAVLKSLAVIETKLTAMENVDERLRTVEIALTAIQAAQSAQRPKAPWWSVVGAVVGVVGAFGTLVGLFVILTQIMEALKGKI